MTLQQLEKQLESSLQTLRDENKTLIELLQSRQTQLYTMLGGGESYPAEMPTYDRSNDQQSFDSHMGEESLTETAEFPVEKSSMTDSQPCDNPVSIHVSNDFRACDKTGNL